MYDGACTYVPVTDRQARTNCFSLFSPLVLRMLSKYVHPDALLNQYSLHQVVHANVSKQRHQRLAQAQHSHRTLVLLPCPLFSGTYNPLPTDVRTSSAFRIATRLSSTTTRCTISATSAGSGTGTGTGTLGPVVAGADCGRIGAPLSRHHWLLLLPFRLDLRRGARAVDDALPTYPSCGVACLL